VRGLRTWVGFRQIGLPYERDKRFAGVPKYTFTKLLSLAYDGIFSISTTPLRIAVYSGFSLAAVAFLGGIWVIYQKLVYGIALVGWASTIVIIMFLGGIILSTLGIIGEYVSRIYEEVKRRPLYVVKDRLGV
jgi:dolichol-phosphate mannosyltransferase